MRDVSIITLRGSRTRRLWAEMVAGPDSIEVRRLHRLSRSVARLPDRTALALLLVTSAALYGGAFLGSWILEAGRGSPESVILGVPRLVLSVGVAGHLVPARPS